MLNDKIVFILGAGATFNEAKEAQANDNPPLDKGFFDKYKDNNNTFISDVKKYLESTYNIDIFDQEYNSLEKIMVILYTDSYRSKNSFEKFRSLVRFLNMRLAESTRDLYPNPVGTFYGIVKNYLNKYESKNITFITFNQDIQIEKLIDKLCNEDIQNKNCDLNFPYCYHLPDTVSVTKVNPKKKEEKTSFFNKGLKDNVGVNILKLHGSLNWYSLHFSRIQSKKALFNPKRPMHIYSNKSLHPDIIQRGIQRKYFSFPIIIPPVIHKSEIFHQHLGIVWEAAQKRLEQATEIIAFGYSFPASDFESANLFKRAMKSNQNELILSIIDPDPLVVSRFASITGIQRINWYKSSMQYLKNIK